MGRIEAPSRIPYELNRIFYRVCLAGQGILLLGIEAFIKAADLYCADKLSLCTLVGDRMGRCETKRAIYFNREKERTRSGR